LDSHIAIFIFLRENYSEAEDYFEPKMPLDLALDKSSGYLLAVD
jgi:hypothetical protein